MRKLFVAVVVATTMAFGGVQACGGSSTSPSSTSNSCPTLSGLGSMCATVDGLSWAASYSGTGRRADGAPRPNPLFCYRGGTSFLVCIGDDSQGREISFAVALATGTQHFGSEGNLCCGGQAAFVDATGIYGAERPGGSGTVMITTLTDTTVSGTFSFTVLNRSATPIGSHVITGGVFNITDANEPPVGS
jgi:hypothetical protein